MAGSPKKVRGEEECRKQGRCRRDAGERLTPDARSACRRGTEGEGEGGEKERREPAEEAGNRHTAKEAVEGAEEEKEVGATGR